MAWLLPELELGLEPELKPLDPVLELLEEPVLDEPVLEEPVLEEPVLEEPVLDDPVLEEPEVDEPVLEDPVLVEVPLGDEPVELAVLWVDPGKARVTAPAATTLAMVTAVVAERTLARPRARAAMACWTRSRGALLMSPILRSGHRHFLRETSRLAMKADPHRLGRGYPANMKPS